MTPICCDRTSSTGDERREHQIALAGFREAIETSTEIQNGFEFQIGAKFDLVSVARVIQFERRCCPFLSFEVRANAGAEPLWVRISGPEGAREVIAAGILGN